MGGLHKCTDNGQRYQTNELFDEWVDCDVYDWNVGVSRFDETTFSCMVFMVLASHGCQLLRLLCISVMSVFIWWFNSWFWHWDSTRSNLVLANPSSSSFTCFNAFSNGSSGPKLLRVCFADSPSFRSLISDDESTSSVEHAAHFDVFSWNWSKFH